MFRTLVLALCTAIPALTGVPALMGVPALTAWNAIANSARAQEPAAKPSVLELRAEIAVSSHVLRFGDLVQFPNTSDPSSRERTLQGLADLPLAPSPRLGTMQTWTRSELESFLSRRGIANRAIEWTGADNCSVRRAEMDPLGTSSAGDPPSSDVCSSNSNPLSYSPAFTTPVAISQAERVVASAIEAYLKLKTGTDGRWRIRPSIPAELANSLQQRSRIERIGGGQAPWDGQQIFTLLLNSPDGEMAVEIPAEVRLPDLVVAAKGPLAKGRVLQENDLVWLPLPPNGRLSADECFGDFESLIGQQLRRAVSTRQPIRRSEVGAPFAVQTGENVTVAVIAGAVRVEAYGRAVESGAVDEIVQVEVLPQRKRVAARVVSERRVEILARGGPSLAGDRTPPRSTP